VGLYHSAKFGYDQLAECPLCGHSARPLGRLSLPAGIMTGQWQVNIPGYTLSHSKQTALYSWFLSHIQHIQGVSLSLDS